jgi:hypothetical protein
MRRGKWSRHKIEGGGHRQPQGKCKRNIGIRRGRKGGWSKGSARDEEELQRETQRMSNKEGRR